MLERNKIIEQTDTDGIQITDFRKADAKGSAKELYNLLHNKGGK